MHYLLNGSDQWQDSGNWRDAVGTADLAVRYLLPIAENESNLDNANFKALAEIGAAAAFLQELPSQMRGRSCDELTRLLKRSSTGPKRGVVRGLIGLAWNPLGTTLNFAMNQLGKQLLSDDELITNFTALVEAAVVDTQLEYVWTHAREFSYDAEFDKEAGRRAYWLAFIWNEQNRLSRFPADFQLDPDVANEAVQRSRRDIQDVHNNPERLAGIWLHSPLFSNNDPIASINRVNELKRVSRKLSKGKSLPEVEQAFAHYRQNIEQRERHIHGFAVRMRWSGA